MDHRIVRVNLSGNTPAPVLGRPWGPSTRFFSVYRRNSHSPEKLFLSLRTDNSRLFSRVFSNLGYVTLVYGRFISLSLVIPCKTAFF